MFKRTFDILFACAALIFTLPFCIVIAIALYFEDDKGPLFYYGERLGYQGKKFKCWKFRTMMSDSDRLLEEYLASNPEARSHWQVYFKLPNDPRIKSKTARFLRMTSLDELPQFWNVLMGDMSIVGPRPILPREENDYGDLTTTYFSVRPGITGLWQVSGRNTLSFKERIACDMAYIQNMSFKKDMLIVLKTIPAMFK